MVVVVDEDYVTSTFVLNQLLIDLRVMRNRIRSARSIRQIITTSYFALSFYVLGALVIENDVNYPTWFFISDTDFPAYHQKLQRLLEPFFMFPIGLLLLNTLLLFWLRPAGVARWSIIAAFLVLIYILVESFLIQVPIHEQLNISKNPILLEELIQTHRSYRLPAEVLLFILNNYILFRLLATKPQLQ